MTIAHSEWVDFLRTDIPSALLRDYLRGSASLRDLYGLPPTLDKIEKQIHYRQSFAPTDRAALVSAVAHVCRNVALTQAQKNNLAKLSQPDTFTICTAHQTNLLSGYLYSFYKIAQTIQLCKQAKTRLPRYHFVPIFFLGSEDHDTEELNCFYLHNQKFSWPTAAAQAPYGYQTIDKPFEDLLKAVENELSAYPHIRQLSDLLRSTHRRGETIETATIRLWTELVGEQGLLFISPNAPTLKRQFSHITEADLFEQQPYRLLEKTIATLAKSYKIQAYARPINTFYLHDGKRARIQQEEGGFRVHDHRLFSATQMRTELQQFPERFSANVILRPLFQEYVLPNLMYVGGGAEISYWLELKVLFSQWQLPFPMLKLRNSMVIVDEPNIIRMYEKDTWQMEDFFCDETTWLSRQIAPDVSIFQRALERIEHAHTQQYAELGQLLTQHAIPLSEHVGKLAHQSTQRLHHLYQRISRYYKRLLHERLSRRNRIRASFFPGQTFQERRENFMPYYARYSADLRTCIQTQIGGFEQGIKIVFLK